MNLKRPEKLIWEEDSPWTWEQIWFSVFESQEKTHDTINQLPGSKINSDINSLYISLEIFLDSIEDLFFSINSFRKNSEKANFWYPSNEACLERLERKINRGVFSSTLAAMSLVDRTRIFSNEYSIEGYQKRVDESFKNNPQHRFIQSLRNYFAHVKMAKANWEIRHSQNEERTVSFLLNKNELLKWKNWDSLAKKYIRASQDDINVENLLKEYSNSVNTFHDWFKGEVSNKHHQKLANYLYYANKVKGVSAYCQWNLLIQQAYIPKGIDPYEYLERHLTHDELEEVFDLPHHSRKQVDRIIEILDEYSVCDDELRKYTYKLFKLSQSP